LDPVGRVELYQVLMELKEQHGMTVLLAECDSEEAAKYSDKVALMKDGRVISFGKPRDVLGDPERLRSLSITPPQVSEVSALLKERLDDSGFSFINVDEAERSICERFTNRKRGSKV
jgi:energy-coupling factor transport system ATP-binding protein